VEIKMESSLVPLCKTLYSNKILPFTAIFIRVGPLILSDFHKKDHFSLISG